MALKVKDPSNRAKAVEVNASDSGVVDEVEELKKKLRKKKNRLLSV